MGLLVGRSKAFDVCLGDLNSLLELGVVGTELSVSERIILFFLIVIGGILRSCLEFVGIIMLVCVWLSNMSSGLIARRRGLVYDTVII